MKTLLKTLVPTLGLTLAIAVLVSATPSVGVALSSNRPGAEAQAAQALARVEHALTNAGVPGLLTSQETKKRLAGDSKNCAGGRKCLTELALQLDAQAVLVGDGEQGRIAGPADGDQGADVGRSAGDDAVEGGGDALEALVGE